MYVADSQHPVRTFATSKNYDVLIVGYEKVRGIVIDQSANGTDELPSPQIRDCADDVKFAQPPVGLIICDEGPSFHLSFALAAADGDASQATASSRRRRRRRRPCSRSRA